MKLFGRGKEKREKQEQETAVLRSQLKHKRKPKKDPIEKVKAQLADFTSRMHQDYKPQEYGVKLWWVLGVDKEGKKHYDMFYTAGEAYKKLATWDDGDVFELRNITTKRDAEKEIDRILEERLEEEQELLQGRLSSIETPRRTVTEPKSPNGRFHLPFPRNGAKPEE